MSSHVVFNGVDDATKKRLEAYWDQKLPRVKKLLTPYREDLREIDLTVYRHPQNGHRSRYEARAVVHLPTGTLAAHADELTPDAAVDRVADTLVTEIRKHKEQVRKDCVFKRKRRERADLSAAGPLLQRDKDADRREDFVRLLRPLLRFLHDHARRELRVLERSGLLHPGEVTVADVLDEVVVRAWQRFADQPRHLSLDLWLTDLLHEVLEEWIKEEPRPHVSLQERANKVQPDRTNREEEPEWWAELPGETETPTLEDLVRADAKSPWDQLEVEEQTGRVLSLLGDLPAARRQAFLLHALEDYSPTDIALLQNRPESEVKADIEAARGTLRERLLAGEHVPETQHPVAAAAARDSGGPSRPHPAP